MVRAHALLKKKYASNVTEVELIKVTNVVNAKEQAYLNHLTQSCAENVTAQEYTLLKERSSVKSVTAQARTIQNVANAVAVVNINIVSLLH